VESSTKRVDLPERRNSFMVPKGSSLSVGDSSDYSLYNGKNRVRKGA
jgi:hypothetical protein